MKPKFEINDSVIVNTGGEDAHAYICYPKRNIHGYFWQEQNCYCCHFQNGTKQYIPARYIRNSKTPACSTVLQLMDKNYLYAESIHMAKMKFPKVDVAKLEIELNNFI